MWATGQLEGTVNPTQAGVGAGRGPTPAQRSNELALTAAGYMAWRRRSLSWLSGGALPLEREAAFFLALCRPQPQQLWLDIGTSAGFYAGVLAGRALRCWPAISARRCCAKQAAANRIPTSPTRCSTPKHTGLPSGSFDGVSIGATLNETAHPRALLAEAQRLLRPGAQLWLMALARDATPKQAWLSRLGGLTFPDEAQLDAWLPQMERVDGWRRSNVLFGRWTKRDTGQAECEKKSVRIRYLSPSGLPLDCKQEGMCETATHNTVKPGLAGHPSNSPTPWVTAAN